MTAAQFAALARLLRLRESAAREGLRLTLIDGLTHEAAAAQSGAPRQSITRGVASARKVLADARVLGAVAVSARRNY